MQATEEPYNLNYKYRGRALIIVNKNFTKSGNKKPEGNWKRKGSFHDRKKMESLFRALDFKVTVFKDLSSEEMKKQIAAAAKDPKNKESDCFALVLSSHGHEFEEKKSISKSGIPVQREGTVWRQQVYGSDCQTVYLDDIIEMFRHEESLKNKPKLFFIQACRSKHVGGDAERYDYGVTINVAITRSLAGSQPSDAGDAPDECLDVEDSLGNKMKDIVDVNRDWKDDNEVHYIDSDDDEDSDDDSFGENDEHENPALLSQSTAEATSQVTYSATQNIYCRSQSTDYSQTSSGKPLATTSQEGTEQLGATLKANLKVDTSTAMKRQTSGGMDVADTVPMSPDRTDAGHSPDTGIMPAMPFDIVGVRNLPDDCLLVYPVMFGKAAFRKENIGSRLLHLMHRKENVRVLLRGGNILQYLTKVAKDLASADITIANNPETVKANVCIQHRLRGKVTFAPKGDKSIMRAIRDLLL